MCGDQDAITIYSQSDRGLLYGACEVLQQAQADGGLVPGGVCFSAPQCPFRGLKVYLPGEKQLDQFYKIVDMLLYYRYNTIIIIEIGGAMEYKRHPEINESWWNTVGNAPLSGTGRRGPEYVRLGQKLHPL